MSAPGGAPQGIDGMTCSTANPLIDYTGLPPFDAFTPEHIEPALEHVLAEARARIQRLTEGDEGFTWNNLVMPVEREIDRVNRIWGPLRHLHAVSGSDELRAVHDRCLPEISRFHTDLAQHQGLCAAYRSLADGPAYAGLDATQRKAVDDALRDFRLGGVDLPKAERERFAEIEHELDRLQARFQDNVLDATNAWSLAIVDGDRLAGLGRDALAMASDAARRHGEQGWRLTLEFPLVHAVLTTAEDRALRRCVYEAWTTRASDRGPHAGDWDNGPVMERILALRQEKAALLGYAHYAELALATRMVRRPAEVIGFLDELAEHGVPAARAEMDELRRFASDQLGIDDLQPWDTAYASEQLRRQRFAISDDQLRPWFPAARVIDGLFSIVRGLYGVRIEPADDVVTWHPDVAYYRLLGADGEERGGFYLDLYARPGKRAGAWMDGVIPRLGDDERVRSPVAFVTCNLTPPGADRAALLTHDEVITLFHEFGHALHHLLTKVDVPSLAGINGVEWDAVELPSQLMENWCWERESLDRIAGHVEDGSALPDDLLARLQASRHFHAALGLVRQIEFSLFDFRLHTEYEHPSVHDIQQLLGAVRERLSPLPPPEWNRFAHGFMHIFAGGYAAGYYSYKWAEVLSADAFGAFEEAGVMDRATGEAFRRAFLEQGGSRPAIESFRAFRGRDPDPEALLRQTGLAA